jgi:hypothetical protein
MMDKVADLMAKIDIMNQTPLFPGISLEVVDAPAASVPSFPGTKSSF